MLNINEDDLKTAIVQKASDEILRQDDDLSEMIRQEVKSRLDKIFADRAEAQIQSAIDAAIEAGFEREYQRVDPYGRPAGESTSISKELGKLVDSYWGARVDPRTGKPTTSDYQPSAEDLKEYYDLGYQAASEGKPESACPQVHGKLCVQWIKGHKKCAQDRKDWPFPQNDKKEDQDETEDGEAA
ncbi:hypothetical protein ACVFVO_12720 [Advenella kashmirensis]